MSELNENRTPRKHIASIYNRYSIDSRILESFTNLSNTVIQTALSGQSKFIFEILQNVDDSFESENQIIDIQFILQGSYLIVRHDGKGFDYNDVERICDFASAIKEVKAEDLNKTGYKGLGFKSLFNLSDCIYIYSNGYSFRFDKSHWPDASRMPWQVIPIWCNYNELPLSDKYNYDEPVNFILNVNDVKLLEKHLQDLVDRPELLLYLNHISTLSVCFNDTEHYLEKKVEQFGLFNKVDIHSKKRIESTWLLRTYERSVPKKIQTSISDASKFIYPDKIKTAKAVPFTFALRSNESMEEISKIKGLCHSTLPTQLHFTLPYHINSLFILNLDRTQLQENEWNEFLIYQIGLLQFSLLKDLAQLPHLKNYVIMLYVRQIDHPYRTFVNAFQEGFDKCKRKIAWLPSYQGLRLLKLGEAWIDETKFFQQNFQNIRDEQIEPYIIDYDIKQQTDLYKGEAKRFTYQKLFENFPKKYYPQLTNSSYVDFISYLYESSKESPLNSCMHWLRGIPFLRGTNMSLLSPKQAFLAETDDPVPVFAMLNLVDNWCLPSNNASSIKDWLFRLGTKRLRKPIEVLKASLMKWFDSDIFHEKINMENHIEIINYLAQNFEQFKGKEREKLKEKILILTEANQFKPANCCYFPNAAPIRELVDIISDNEKISSCYDMDSLKGFFINVGVIDLLSPFDALRRSILLWISNKNVKSKLTKSNYLPIIEYISRNYSSYEGRLSVDEKKLLKNMPVLNSDNKFTKAENCYFDSAIPNVPEFQTVIASDKLVLTRNMSEKVYKFLQKMGVSDKMSPMEILRRSVLKWIHEGLIQNNITFKNHADILSYIAEQWDILNSSSGLNPNERKSLKKIHVLTKGNTLRAACECYWTPDDTYYGEIPGLLSVIPPEKFVSPNYSLKIQDLLKKLGVNNLRFIDIYKIYCCHLNSHENMEWFFYHLSIYYEGKKESAHKDELLNYLKQKFQSSRCLLAKNRKMYCSTKLYSSQFRDMHDLDPNAVPLLDYEGLSKDLENWLGFKTELELSSIVQLLDVIRGKTNLGEKKTLTFFTTLLEQLRNKTKKQIKSHKLSLLSKDNKLKLAKDLYYFIEEDATCFLDSMYLKRICGMSHEDTLELAELCGANVLPFQQEPQFGKGERTLDDSLKEFYFGRLPFIVLQESKELNEPTSTILKRLYDKICSIELYKCLEIFIKYPFGSPHKVAYYFEDLKLYTVGRWTKWKVKDEIHDHLKKELGFKTNIKKIIGMELSADDIDEWLEYKEERLENLQSVDNELQELRSKRNATFVDHETDDSDLSGEKDDFSDEIINEHISAFADPDCVRLVSPEESSSDEEESLTREDYPEIIADMEKTSVQIPFAMKTEENAGYDALKNVLKVRSGHEASHSSDDEDCMKVNEKKLVLEDWISETLKEKLQTQADLSRSQSVKNFSTFVGESGSEERQVDLLNENHQFVFLYNHFKNKHPNSRCNLSGGIFTIRWQPSLTKEVIWLNENDENYS